MGLPRAPPRARPRIRNLEIEGVQGTLRHRELKGSPSEN